MQCVCVPLGVKGCEDGAANSVGLACDHAGAAEHDLRRVQAPSGCRHRVAATPPTCSCGVSEALWLAGWCVRVRVSLSVLLARQRRT